MRLMGSLEEVENVAAGIEGKGSEFRGLIFWRVDALSCLPIIDKCIKIVMR